MGRSNTAILQEVNFWIFSPNSRYSGKIIGFWYVLWAELTADHCILFKSHFNFVLQIENYGIDKKPRFRSFLKITGFHTINSFKYLNNDNFKLSGRLNSLQQLIDLILSKFLKKKSKNRKKSKNPIFRVFQIETRREQFLRYNISKLRS